ncbi:MAG: pentapeptide repeat-containing protein [Candidatus Solibacter usitatus]|nr:pentapeptide repeat-containing protein [Candidatus Solibacter usitatus]
MVSGTKWPSGDPFLTKQNEPSIAVSSLNAQHLLAGANDYRLVDLSQAVDIPGETGAGDAWIFLFTSVDGGASWRSRAMSGCPLNVAQCNNPLSSAIKGRQFAADPTVRPGPYGTFFLSFIAANRGTSTDGVVGVQRFFDRNNNVNIGDDPIVEDVVNVLDTGTSGQFKDKPWVIADVGGRSWNGASTCTLPGFEKAAPAFNVYVSYSNFVGNSGSNPHPQILVARSVDCGKTFQKPVKVSNSVDTNSGSVVTIDPQTGTIYVIWRRFGDAAAGTQDGIYVSKSTDGGSKFSNPSLIASFQAFDQGTSAYSFRTNALPSAAVSVGGDGKSRVHVVWSQRKANGDARIAMSTSVNAGNNWSTPQYVDDWTSDPANPANPGRGHQFQPTLTFAGGKLMAAWFDQRYDHTVGVLECPSGTNCKSIAEFVERREPVGALASGQVSTVFSQYLTDAGLTRRHTIDTFSAMADPSNQPVFQSSRVSQFLHGNVAVPPKGSKQIRQLRFNVPNLPIFVNNSRSFLGDYLDVAAQSIIPTGNAAQPYVFNTAATEKPVFHVTWTDNRDVVPPLKSTSTWQHTPSAVLVVNADGSVTTAPNPNCIPGFDGSKNQNIYTAKVGEGVAGFVQVNSKDLSSTVKRGFVVGVQNMLTTSQTFQLRIPSQPSGGSASFDQTTTGVTQVTLSVPARSSASRVVWVTAGSLKASLSVEIADSFGVLLKTLILNPDPNATGAFLPNPAGDISSNDLSDASVKNVELTNVELTNVELTNVELTNVELTNVELTNVELTNVELTNVELTNVELTNVELTNVELTNVELTNVELTNNNFQNVELTNGGLADTTFTVTNRGTADTTLNIKTLLKDQKIPEGYKLQLAMRKISPSPSAQMTQAYLNRPVGQCKIAFAGQNIQNANIPDPKVENPADGTLGQFQVTNSNANNATLPLLAGERAQITMRILGPSQAEVNSYAQNAIKFVGIGASGSITPIPLIIKTLSLPAGTALQFYSYQIEKFGGAGTITFCQPNPAIPNATQCVLPAWLSITAGGLLSGTPPSSGTFMLTVRVSDTGSVPPQSDVQTLALAVSPAVQTVTFALPASLNFGDTLTLSASASGGTVTFAASGSCTVSGTTLSTTGAGLCTVVATQAGSSVYAPASATASMNVLKGNQSISFGPLSTKTYGSAPFAVSASATSGLPVSFSASGSCSVSGNIVSISAAGTCTVTASQAGNANYNPAPPAGQTFSITAATLTVTAQDASRSYGAANPAFSAALSGFVNGDTLATAGVTGGAACTTTATATSPTGTYPITCTQGTLAAANYTFAFAAGTLTIGKATLAVTADNLSRAYGAANPALTYAISGYLNGDTMSVVSGAAACATTATATSVVGTYPITCGSGTLTATNYTFTFVDGTLSVVQAGQSITFAALAGKTYGDASFVVSASASSGLAVTFSAAGSCSVSGNTVSISAAGSCTLTANQAGDSNYNPAPAVGQTFSISAATLTVKAQDASRSYGAANPAFSSVLSGYVNGDTPATAGVTGNAACTTAATATSPTGTYPITCTQGTLAAANYTFAFAAGTLTIGKATLAVTADNLSRAYGAANPALTYAISGYLNGDTISAVTGAAACSTTAAAGSPVGAYPISCAPGTLAAVNYTFTFAGGSLSVTKALLTVTAVSQQRLYGTPNPTFNAVITGFVNGETQATAGIGGTLTFATPAVLLSDVGIYAVVPSGLTASNYAFTYGAGSLTVLIATPVFSNLSAPAVAPGAPTATISGKLTWAGLAPPGSVAISLNGGLAQQAAIGAGGSFSASVPAELSTIGAYPVSFSYPGASPNYTAATASATLKVEGFLATGNMQQTRREHTATLMNNGMVLIAGGLDSSGAPTATAEVYNPSNGTFHLAGNMPNKATGHAAVLLANGKVLITGGGNSATELFDSATETFSPVGGMSSTRSYHTATLLQSGKVLLAGGVDNGGKTINTTLIFDPATLTYTAGPNMTSARDRHTAVRLADGRVLIAGGRQKTGANYNSLSSAEIYDPATGTGTFVATAGMGAARHAHTAVLLANGKVLLAGGSNGTADLASAVVFDPAAGTFTATTTNMATARSNHAGISLADGTPLVAGGKSGAAAVTGTEFYSGTFSAGPAMLTARSSFTMTLLQNGNVLVTGGAGTAGSAVATAEVYTRVP